MAFKISNIYKSLVRHAVDTIESIKDQGVSPLMQYHSWDARGEENELPSVDLIGLAGWTFREDGGLWVINCGVTVSTINDDNLFREALILDIIHDFWGEAITIPLRDDNGNEYTQLRVEDFEIMPAGQSEKRNYRPVGLGLQRTGSG